MVRIVIVQKHRGRTELNLTEEEFKRFEQMNECELCNGTGELMKEVYDYDAHRFAPVEIVPCLCQYKDEFQSLIDPNKDYNLQPDYDDEEKENTGEKEEEC